MSTIEWTATVGGLLLVAAGLREVFHTLLHPSGEGQITPAVFRGVWRLSRRLGASARRLAGPVGMVASITTWTLLLVVGWALVYWPHLPEQFQVAEGIPAGRQGSVLDAVYVSGVTLSTLGFGDFVAEGRTLRLATAAEALVGFALLTASISWVLSIYPALMRRRALAARIGSLVEGDGPDARLRGAESPTALAIVLHGVADQLGTVRVDLVQYPASYFFHGPMEALSLPAVLPRLQRAIARDDLREAASAVAVVRSSIAELGRTLEQGPFGIRADDPDAAIAAYANDHRRRVGLKPD